MTDLALAIFALAGLGLFLGVIVFTVNIPDLSIVVGVVLAMACYDFAREFLERWKNGD